MIIRSIIIINDSANINGGGAKVAIMTAIGLAKKGYNVCFFCGIPPKYNYLKKYNIKIVSTNQCDILNEKNRGKAIVQGLWNQKAYRYLDSLLHEYNRENTIIHVHVWCKVLSSSIFAAIKKNKFKTIITLHDYFTECANGGLYNYKTHKICTIKPCSFKCLYTNCDSRNYIQKIYRFSRLLIQKYFLSKIDKSAIVISNYSYNIFKKIGALNKYNNIYNIPDPVELHKKDGQKELERNKYLFIGRMEEDKGIKLFCEALKRTNKKGIALGNGYLLEKCKREYENIDFKGWVNLKDMISITKDCKAIIVGTLWHETFGLVVLEMKSLAIPAIVPDRHASSDFITDNYDGCIYKSGNVDSLVEAINKFETHPDSYYIKNISYKFKPEEYSEELYIDRLINSYNTNE